MTGVATTSLVAWLLWLVLGWGAATVTATCTSLRAAPGHCKPADVIGNIGGCNQGEPDREIMGTRKAVTGH